VIGKAAFAKCAQQILFAPRNIPKFTWAAGRSLRRIWNLQQCSAFLGFWARRLLLPFFPTFPRLLLSLLTRQSSRTPSQQLASGILPGAHLEATGVLLCSWRPCTANEHRNNLDDSNARPFHRAWLTSFALSTWCLLAAFMTLLRISSLLSQLGG